VPARAWVADVNEAGAQVLYVMPHVARFLVHAECVDQRALEPRPESVLGTIGIETMEP